ncbi:MAG: Flp pilus assembly complex ATPase component TadA [Armatimonadetes bacterium]|nr:Flp pilus assembly complex ATPase component TadA [Armatimonadota bacterium]
MRKTRAPRSPGPRARASVAKPGVEEPGHVLLSEGRITAEQLEQAIEYQHEQGTSLARSLVDLGFVSEDEVADALARLLGLRRVKIRSQAIDVAALSLLDTDFCMTQRIATISRDGNKILAVTPDPLNLPALDEVRHKLADYEVEVAVVTDSEFDELTQSVHCSEAVAGEIAALQEQYAAGGGTADAAEEASSDKPTVRLTRRMMTRALAEQASDIHIEPHGPHTLIRMRIDGVLRDIAQLPQGLHKMLVAHLKILADLDIAVTHVPQDGHFRWQPPDGRSIDVRLSTLPVVGGEKIVLRLLGDDELLSLDQLGFPAELVEQLRSLLDRSQGMILVTGPTGSGKTSTLYASLNYVMRKRPNITTIEDPVERDILGINQVQVNEKRGLTFLTALRSILRQDPDVIMIGETRDLDTARTAAQAPLTGHLVLTTLHTNDAVSAVTRLVDLGLPPYLIASTLLGSLAQRLVRKNCPHCAEWVPLRPHEARLLREVGLGDVITRERRGQGCQQCHYTGFTGRKALGELLVISPQIQELITEGASEEQLRTVACEQGMRTVLQVATDLLLEGETTVAEVLRVAPWQTDPAEVAAAGA